MLSIVRPSNSQLLLQQLTVIAAERCCPGVRVLPTIFPHLCFSYKFQADLVDRSNPFAMSVYIRRPSFLFCVLLADQFVASSLSFAL